ncbi:MAG: hypothetical protein CVU40_02570 [Chloroflexi bacterium HGW-Chloroflexi-2]|jgi:hypothetical protein|nr:MAG: hypothetical protein CVU40_02570 [Chloroflexi bacterium HGW-Chloroflexi-2]
MKIIIDQKTVQRNATIGKILRWVSLGCMLIGLIAVFSEEIFSNPNLFTIFFSIMIVGVLLSSVSGFFTNRFGKSPRPDELIDKTFKGLDDRFQIFHYRSSIHHLLIGPAGLWSIVPTFIDGEIIYDENKENWTHKRNSLVNRLLQKEYFPNPLSEYKHHKKELEKILKEKTKNDDNPELKLLVLLLNKNVSISGNFEKDNILIMPFEKVKDRFRKMAKNINLSDEVYALLEDLLEIQ